MLTVKNKKIITILLSACLLLFLPLQINVSNYYPPTKSEGYSFGVIRPSVRPSIRPHFLSVRNRISVPIGQI